MDILKRAFSLSLCLRTSPRTTRTRKEPGRRKGWSKATTTKTTSEGKALCQRLGALAVDVSTSFADKKAYSHKAYMREGHTRPTRLSRLLAVTRSPPSCACTRWVSGLSWRLRALLLCAAVDMCAWFLCFDLPVSTRCTLTSHT